MGAILTKKQLSKRNSQILKWLNKLVSAKERKDLIESLELASTSFGTESSSTLYLTKHGLMETELSTEYTSCDKSTKTTESMVSKREFREIIEEYDELDPKTLERLHARLIA